MIKNANLLSQFFVTEIVYIIPVIETKFRYGFWTLELQVICTLIPSDKGNMDVVRFKKVKHQKHFVKFSFERNSKKTATCQCNTHWHLCI